jgi:hypothetical protein
MTTPPSPITVSVATDKQTYNVGDPIDVTVTYTDSATGALVTMTVSATVTDSSGNTATGTADVQVNNPTQETFTVEVTDSFGDAYNLTSNANGTALASSTVGSPPAAVPAA